MEMSAAFEAIQFEELRWNWKNEFVLIEWALANYSFLCDFAFIFLIDSWVYVRACERTLHVDVSHNKSMRLIGTTHVMH